MSVINTVLKDLENRSSQFTPIDIASVENQGTRKPKQIVSYAMALLMILLLAGLAFGLYLLRPIVVDSNRTWSNYIKDSAGRIEQLKY